MYLSEGKGLIKKLMLTHTRTQTQKHTQTDNFAVVQAVMDTCRLAGLYGNSNEETYLPLDLHFLLCTVAYPDT